MITPVSRRAAILLGATGLAGLALPRGARAATRLRVAKANSHAMSFTPLDVGIAKGFFPGLDIQILDFNGAAKAMQGLIGGAVDIYLGGGSDFAFAARGVPMTAVAALAGPPLLLCLVVRPDSPIKTLDDFKGKKVQVSTAGSTAEWLVKDLAVVKGWGPDGIIPVAIGGDIATQVAALRTGQVDAIVASASLAFELEERNEGRMVAPTADYVKDFLLHAIFATNALIQSDPDAVRAFLEGWFRSIAFMRAHRNETVKLIMPVTQADAAAEDKEYDLVMPMFSADGKFPPKALETLAQSFVDLKMLEQKPDMAKLLTERFLPSA